MSRPAVDALAHARYQAERHIKELQVDSDTQVRVRDRAEESIQRYVQQIADQREAIEDYTAAIEELGA